MKKCGIYQIRNLINNKVYIGQSIDLRKRKSVHWNLLKNNKDTNIHLQRAYNKYGKENFVFEIVLYCEDYELLYYEDGIKNIYKDNCYNIRECSCSNAGIKFSEEVKFKMRKPRSQEGRENIRKGKLGNKNCVGNHMTDSSKKKSSENKCGNKNNKNGTSKYTGLSHNKYGKWGVRIKYFGKTYYLGSFTSEIEAALVYNGAALELWGWHAKLNIITQEEIEKLWMEE